MQKREPGGDALRERTAAGVGPLPTLAAAKQARGARRTRQFITLKTLNAASAVLPDFDDLDFAALDEPREPEKWY
jgi:hypothetical protein